MRKYLFRSFQIFSILILNNITYAQIPNILWQKSFGGSGTEHPFNSQRMIQTSDGGYIMAGYSDSNDGDVGINYGRSDIWIIKLDAQGNLQWKRSIGGIGSEVPNSIQQTFDGGFIIAGSHQNVNNVSGNGNHGSSDFYIVKLSSNGVIQYSEFNLPQGEQYGGTGGEIASSIQQTLDSGYIVAGYSYSSDGDLSTNYGQSDYWIVKLNSLFVIQWQKTYGGSLEDEAQSIQQTSDGGYIVAGNSRSHDFDVTSNIGNHDYWILKLNSVGELVWQGSYGGSAEDYPKSIHQTNDGGYIIAGYTISQLGLNNNQFGSFDYYVVKINATGTIQWHKSYGGRKDDVALAIQITCDDGYILSGYSFSVDGDITNHHGSNTTSDSWIVKLTSTGIIEWENSLGGSNIDAATSIQQTEDKGYIICGYSFSSDGDVTLNHGQEDFWIVKLQQPPLITTSNGSSTFCNGDSLSLYINSGSSFLWNNGDTTHSINIKTSGTYSAIVNNCYVTEDKIIKCNYCDFDVSFNALLEGFYLDSNSMISVIDPMNQPIICDTVFLQLTQPEFPYSVIYSKSVLIDNHGKGLTHFTTSPEYDKYYFVLRHRNSIETWSKSPITIGLNTTFGFTE